MAVRRDGWGVPLLCLAGVALGWGSIPVFLRYFTDYVDAWTANGVRYPIGALFWLPFVIVVTRRGASRSAPASGRSVWRDALVPSLVNVLAQTGYAMSPYYLPAATVAFVIRLSFLFTLVFGLLVLADERVLARRPVFWVGVAASVVGVLLMFIERLGGRGDATLAGLAIVVGSAAAWGAYAVSVRKWMASYSARLSFGVISLYAGAALFLLMLAFGRTEPLGHLPAKVWVCLAVSALIGVAFGHVLYYRAIHRLGPIVCGGLLLVTPFVTCLGAELVGQERLTLVQFLGGIAIVLGGALLLKAKGETERPAAPESLSRKPGLPGAE